MKKLLSFLAIIIVLALIVVPRVMEKVNAPEAVEEVKVIAVGGMQILSGDMSSVVELIGSTSPDEMVNVMVSVPAEVEDVKVSVGDYVEEGDVLFVLDAESVEDQVTQAEIGLTLAQVGVSNANASVNQANLSYNMAKSNFDMQMESFEFSKDNLADYEQLLEEGIVSQMEFDQVRLQSSDETASVLRSQLDQASAGLSQARLGIDSAEASLLQAQEGYDSAAEMLEDMTVTAPVGGFVTTSNVTVNNYASSAQAAMVIQNMDTIVVSASVTESLVSKIAIGDTVTVTIEALDGKTFDGTIDTLSTSADTRTLLFPMTIKVDNKDHEIKPGMFADVTVTKSESKNTLYVPAEAVVLRDDVNYLYILSGEDHAVRVPIEVGIDNGFYTEILSGVDAEDIIITNGIGLIDELSTIKVIRSDQ